MKIKSKLESDKKAYVQLDFIFATVIFFIFFVFIFTYLDSYEELSDETYKVKQNSVLAKDLCYSLTQTSGLPNDWENNVSNAEQIGLKEYSEVPNKNILDQDKLSAFNSTNLGYISNTLGDNVKININIIGILSNTNHLSFGFPTEEGIIGSSYICFSTYNDEIVKVIVEVWK